MSVVSAMGRQRTAVEVQARQELARNVLRVASASAITGKQQLAARTEGTRYSARNRADGREETGIARGALQALA